MLNLYFKKFFIRHFNADFNNELKFFWLRLVSLKYHLFFFFFNVACRFYHLYEIKLLNFLSCLIDEYNNYLKLTLIFLIINKLDVFICLKVIFMKEKHDLHKFST